MGSHTSTTFINILFISFFLMTTISSTKIHKPTLKTNMTNIAKTTVHAKPEGMPVKPAANPNVVVAKITTHAKPEGVPVKPAANPNVVVEKITTHAKPEGMPVKPAANPTEGRLEAFVNNRKQRQAEEKKYLTQTFNASIKQRQADMKQFQDKVTKDIANQRQQLKDAIEEKVSHAEEAVQNATKTINNKRAEVNEVIKTVKNDIINRANKTYTEESGAAQEFADKFGGSIKNKINEKIGAVKNITGRIHKVIAEFQEGKNEAIDP